MAADASNPFATRFIRPGATKYLFPPGVSAATLLADFNRHGLRGCIVGPHGSGKSSLIAALVSAFVAAGKQVVQQQLHDRQRGPNWLALNAGQWSQNTVVIIDGYEQLSLWQRLILRARCWQRGAGLLVTAHHRVGLPVLLNTQPTLELALSIVQQLLPDSDDRITPADVAEAFTAERGDLREMLLRLFDVYRDAKNMPHEGQKATRSPAE